MAAVVLWFRRDLRLDDHPALVAAVERAEQQRGRVVPLFVIDPAFSRAGAPRRSFLADGLAALHSDLGGRLVVRTGDPVAVVPAVAAECAASAVVVTDDFGPYGRRRDDAVEAALARGRVDLVRAGTPYVVPPGVVRTGAGHPCKVFTPFARAWRQVGAEAPRPRPRLDALASTGTVASEPLPRRPPCAATLPAAGERAARQRLEEFLASGLDGYAEGRDRPALEHTSRLSPYLRWGCIHPRTVVAALPHGADADKLRSEIIWREFYADVLWHRPDSAWAPLQPRMAALEIDEGPTADARFAAWCAGETGYPIVDAGMRQLAAEAWMHNRVRMITASFLVKDLHLPWQRGARFFLDGLVDGDLASNNHGWQWVAGTGTDAAPFFRIFNPDTQAARWDPSGEYVRRWVPDILWPARIVDHAAERTEALRRYAATG